MGNLQFVCALRAPRTESTVHLSPSHAQSGARFQE